MEFYFTATECNCHIWSHSVTCHPTPRFNPSQTRRYSTYLPQGDGRLSWPGVISTKNCNIWNRNRMKFGRNVLLVTEHRLTESDDITVARWRPMQGRNFTQKSAATWW